MREKGWYWVQKLPWRGEPAGEWEPAMWDGRAWHSAKWGNHRDDSVEVGEPIKHQSPGNR